MPCPGMAEGPPTMPEDAAPPGWITGMVGTPVFSAWFSDMFAIAAVAADDPGEPNDT